MQSEGAFLMDDDAVTPVPEELLLTDEDFPRFYINKQHPDDYKIATVPIEKELIFHEYQGRHPRLLLRCSVKLATDRFCPMTFVLDTGAPKVYHSEIAKDIFTEHGILAVDDDLGINFVKFMGRKYRCEDTPEGHAPANIIGLKTLCRWGLLLLDEPTFGYRFEKDFDFIQA